MNSFPMTLSQQAACLHWVEAMLSGNYYHGRGMLYNHETDCYSAIGVAKHAEGWPVNELGYFVDAESLGWNSERDWFNTTFGLPRDADLYTTLNNMSRDYLAVASLVLNAVPDKNPTKALIQRQFMEAVSEYDSTKARR